MKRRPVGVLMIMPALALVASVGGCGSGISDKSFFPIDPGRSWTYRVTKTLDEALEPEVETLTLTTMGSQTLQSGPAMRRHTDTGLDYWLRSDDTGIYRVASRGVLEDHPTADNPPRFVLKKPYSVGTQWEASTVAYVLQRRNEVPKEIRYTHKPVMMVYRIDALDQKVDTAAGKFEGCLRVAGEAKIKLYVDAQFSWRDIPMLTTEWYCPGAGLVRTERIEKSPSKFMVGGSVTLDLMRLQ